MEPKIDLEKEAADIIIGADYIKAHRAGPFTSNPEIQPHEEAAVKSDRELAATLGFDERSTELYIKSRLMGRRHDDVIRRQEHQRLAENYLAKQINPAAPTNTTKFVPNNFQREILDALDGRALKKADLAHEVCGGADSRLYNSKTRKGELNELRDLHLVEHKPRLGYYRPDAPPVD